jgi:hypothetical protein
MNAIDLYAKDLINISDFINQIKCCKNIKKYIICKIIEQILFSIILISSAFILAYIFSKI